jgi:DNA-binding transcriptional regulator YbjK
MNQQDQDNLQFILNASQEVLNDWYSSISDDDREYAHLLLDIRAAELKDAAVALRIEAELAVNPDYSEAKSILDKIAKP